MTITLCYSMQFAEKAEEISKWFAEHGHIAHTTGTNSVYIGLSDEEKETLKLHNKYENDAIREHWEKIQTSDGILVLNYTKHDIDHYIGGNVFLEIGFAYVLRKKIFLLNPIPEMPYYKTEIIGMKPIIVDGDLERVLK